MQAETALLSQGLARKRESMRQKKSLLSRITDFTKDKTSGSSRKPAADKSVVKIGKPQLASMSLAMYDEQFTESKHGSSFLRGSDTDHSDIAGETANKVVHTSYKMAGPISGQTTANTSYNTAYSTQADIGQPVVKDADLSRSIAEFKQTSIPSPTLSRSSSLSDYQIPSLNNSITSIDWLQARFDESRSALCTAHITSDPPKTVHPVESQIDQVLPSKQEGGKTDSSCHTSMSNAQFLPRESSPDQTTVCTVSSADMDDVDIYEEEFIFDDAQRTKAPSWKNSIAKLDEPTHLQDLESPRRMQYRKISLWRPGTFISRAKNAQPPLHTPPHTSQRGSGYGRSSRDPSIYELTLPSATPHTHRDTILPMMHPGCRDSWYLNARIRYLEARERAHWSNIISGLPRFLPVNHN